MSSGSSLDLFFCGIGELYLQKTVFSHTKLYKPLVGIRYSGTTLPTGFGNFRWSTGTIAISLLFLQAKLNSIKGINDSPVMEGLAGSVARAVNIALVKPRMWLFDIFGYDSEGMPLIRRLVTMCNSNFRHGQNPIRIFFKNNELNPSNINIFLDDKKIESAIELSLLCQNLEEQYNKKNKSPNSKKPEIDLLEAA